MTFVGEYFIRIALLSRMQMCIDGSWRYRGYAKIASPSSAVTIDLPFSFRGRFRTGQRCVKSSGADKSMGHVREMRVWGLKHRGGVAEPLDRPRQDGITHQALTLPSSCGPPQPTGHHLVLYNLENWIRF